MALQLFISLGFLFASVSPLSKPRMVVVVSNNMGAIVRWDAPLNSPGNLTYTAEYKGPFNEFQAVCKGIKEHQCDFGELPSCFGIYIFRVRAEQRENNSKWVVPPKFIPEKHTIIGPPTVTLVANSRAIEVDIRDPVLKISPLRKVYHKVDYNIMYWKKSHRKDVFVKKVTEQSVKLKALELNTWYCIQVNVYIQAYNITGQYSNATCEIISTTGEPSTLSMDVEQLRSKGLVESLVVVAVALPLLILSSWFIYKGKRFLNPNVKLPEHFKEHVFEAPCGNISLPTLPLQEKYDEISNLYEEDPYDQMGVVCEESLYNDCGISEEMPDYYNAPVDNDVFDMHYKNVSQCMET